MDSGISRRAARTAVALAATLLGGAVARPRPMVHASDGGGAAPQEPRSYGVEADLVRVAVTARTAAGALVRDLRPEGIQVFENGVEQRVVRFAHEDASISVVVLFDKSASMADQKIMHARDGVVSFVRALRPSDEVLLAAFSERIDILAEFGLGARTVERAAKRIRAESSTRLYDAIVEGVRGLAAPGRKEKRALLTLSHGEDTASVAQMQDAIDAVRRSGVPVYAIGIEMDADTADADTAAGRYDPRWNHSGYRDDTGRLGFEPPWNRPGPPSPPRPKAVPGSSAAIRALSRLTEGTGGWTYPIEASRRCKEVCLRVAEELRHQYLVGYVPSATGDSGEWRSLGVRTTRPGIELAARSGYQKAAP